MATDVRTTAPVVGRLFCALCFVRSVAVRKAGTHGACGSPLCDAVLVRASHLCNAANCCQKPAISVATPRVSAAISPTRSSLPSQPTFPGTAASKSLTVNSAPCVYCLYHPTADSAALRPRVAMAAVAHPSGFGQYHWLDWQYDNRHICHRFWESGSIHGQGKVGRRNFVVAARGLSSQKSAGCARGKNMMVT